MNTPFDKFIEDGKHNCYGITVRELRQRLEELELLGMSDYKVTMFPDEDTDETVTVGTLWFNDNEVSIST